jgi:hypothetical protein
MEKEMISKIAPYFEARRLFEKHDPNSLPSLNIFPFFKRENIKAYLDKHYRLTPEEEKEFLSWSLECIIMLEPENDLSKANELLRLFKKEFDDFSVNKAVLNALVQQNFCDEIALDDLLDLLRNLEIKPGSLEAFELMAKYTERFREETVRSSESTKRILYNFKMLAEKFEVDLKGFEGCFESFVTDYEKHHHYNSAAVLREFVEEYLKEKPVDIIRKMNPGKYIPTGEELAKKILGERK